MKAIDLIRTAERLLDTRSKRPPEADLRRALSTAYYAVFHALALVVTDGVCGTTGLKRARRQVYRSLMHRETSRKFRDHNAVLRDFPKEVADFAATFISLQTKREDADYDPDVQLTKTGVSIDLEKARRAVLGLAAVSMKDKRALAAFVLLPDRALKNRSKSL